MTKDRILTVRIEEDVYAQFINKCESMNQRYSNVIREIMIAFNEGRLKIQQTKEQLKKTKEQLKKTGEFYVN